MLKKHVLLGFVALLGLVAVEACSDSDSPPSNAETAGGGGQENAAGGGSAGAGRAGSASSAAGAMNESAGSGGESAGDAGAAGSFETAGEAGNDTGGHAGMQTTGGAGGVGGTGGTGGTTNPANTFTLETTTLGQVIGTASGRSLYVFKPDTAGAGQIAPVSACTGACLTTWPLYYGTPVSVPTGLLASDFGSFDRGGGVLQSTYKGWPLYTYSDDANVGDVNGEGIGAKWYSAKSPFVAPQ